MGINKATCRMPATILAAARATLHAKHSKLTFLCTRNKRMAQWGRQAGKVESRETDIVGARHSARAGRRAGICGRGPPPLAAHKIYVNAFWRHRHRRLVLNAKR